MFSKTIKESKVVIVKFGTQWCGPCKLLHKQMKKDESDIIVIEVDAEYEEEFAEKHKIRSFPTIFFYKNGVKQQETVVGSNFDKIVEIYNTLNV